jgi:hypothetical protein
MSKKDNKKIAASSQFLHAKEICAIYVIVHSLVHNPHLTKNSVFCSQSHIP